MTDESLKGHRQRLRDKYKEDNQMETFKPYEVLELLLFYSIPRADTKPIARELIEKFGSFSGVIEASVEELLDVEGVGEKTAILLKLMPNIFRYYRIDKVQNYQIFNSIEKIGDYIGPKYIGQTDEIVYLICLGDDCRMLSCEKISQGIVNTTSVSPRKIAQIALRVGATRVVLTHNHPNSFALPSTADVRTTKELKDILYKISIILEDHLIFAASEDEEGYDYVSLKQSGFLED